MPTVRHNLPHLVSGQAEGHVTHNTALNDLDAFVNAVVESKTATDPTLLTPANGDMYIVGPSATNVWTGQDNKLALYMTGWTFFTPPEGFIARVKDEEGSYYVYDGGWTGCGIRGSGFHQHATNGGTLGSRYFLPGMDNFGAASALTNGTFTTNSIFAVPLVIPRGSSIVEVAINITTLGNFNTNYSNIGIYRANSLDDIFPVTKLWDSGSLTWGGTGVQTISVSPNVKPWPGFIHWLAWNSAVSTGQMRLCPVANMRTIGYPSTLPTAASVGVRMSGQTHSGSGYTLPSTFPTTTLNELTAAPIPAVFYRLG